MVIDAESSKHPVTFAELRAKPDSNDRAIALNALQVALTEVGDGASLMWQRPSRELTGVIKPISAFRDDEGRVFRHLTYSLSLGTLRGQGSCLPRAKLRLAARRVVKGEKPSGRMARAL